MCDTEITDREGVTLADRYVPKDRLFDEMPGIVGKMVTGSQFTIHN